MFRSLYAELCRAHGIDDKAASAVVLSNSQPSTPQMARAPVSGNFYFTALEPYVPEKIA
jgi:hypothetical protein